MRVTDTIFSTNLNLSSLTASYAVVTDENKNLVSRNITNNTSAVAVTASDNLITANTLYYHKGNSNLVTVGTVTSGTWNASVIGVAYGGTGAAKVNKNLFFAGSSTTDNTAPSWRKIAAADLPIATTSAVGGISVGTGLSVTTAGALSVAYGTGASKAVQGNQTLVTLNGTNKTAASIASFYAPTGGGTAGYILKAGGANTAPDWIQTVPVSNGGTGVTSFTANSLIMSGNSTTAALTTRGITNTTTAGALGGKTNWGSDDDTIPTMNTIAYWDGRYKSNDNKSNLTYLNKRFNFPTITDGTGVTALDNGSGNSPRYRPASWKFNAGIAPIDGDVVTVKKPSALHDYGTWLSLDNGTTWYPIVYANTSRLPDWFSNNYSITLRFDAVGTCSVFGSIDATNKVMLATDSRSTITGVWRLWTMYDSGNTNDTATLIRDYGGNVAIVTTTTALYYSELMFSVIDTNYGWKAIPANTTKKGHGSTAKTNIFTSEFNPFGYIYLYITDADVAANATIRADRIYRHYPVDLRYSFNTGTTLTAGKDVYVVAYLTGPCKAKLRNPGATGSNAAATATGANAGPITQTLPVSADGYIYIKLGRAYSTYQIDLTLDHPIYYHDGVAIRLLAQTPSYGTNLPANGKEGQLFYQVSDPWYELPSGGSAGQVLTKASSNNYDVTWGENTRTTFTLNNSDKFYVCGSIAATTNTNNPIFNTAVYVQNGKLFGAAWNDYAEYRKCEVSTPGACIVENDDGHMTVSNRRLIAGAAIVTDTYGMCIGEIADTNVPVAVTGRVLAYTFLPRRMYHAGQAVCSAPGGTIDIMTREEIQKYPDAIIGIVSEIPDYEEWGENHVKVDGRIWIKIK